MESFITSIRRKYRERRLLCEEQWPPVRGDRLINLQLVEAQKEEGFRAGLPQHGAPETLKRTPILYGDLFKTNKDKKSVRRIIVEGNAGMGKTTLCTMLAEGWAEGKILTQFDCVLLLPLRDSRVSSATSLPELFKLLHSSDEIRLSVVKELEKNEGEGVLIIADGWDELSEENHFKDSFLYDLLFGSILPFASVLLTSRPSASAPLHNLPSVDRLVEVAGFNEENVKQYIQSEFEKHPKKALSLIEEVENNPVIQSVCSVPLNCAIVCNLWHTLDQSLPRTLTQLYTKIVLSIVFRNIKKKFPKSSIGLSLNSFNEIPDDLQNTFWLICEFAYECLLLDQLVFSEAELATRLPDMGQKLHCFGLLQSARSLLPVGHGLSFHFAHLTIQEFLAALHLATLSNGKKLKVSKDLANNKRFDMVWRFVFGLAGSMQNSCSKVIALGADMFKNFISQKKGFAEYSFLFLCLCAFETSLPNFARVVISVSIYKQYLFRLENLTPYDSIAHFFVLRHMNQCDWLADVTIYNCGLTDKILIELTDILCKTNDKLKLNKISLSNNKLSSSGMSDLFERACSVFSMIRTLYIQSNNLSDVMSLMSISCQKLMLLDLSNNPLGMTGLQSLEKVVQSGNLINLSFLYLSNTFTDDADINESLLVTLLPSLASHCYKLKTLNLSENSFSVQNLCTIADNTPSHLESLSLCYTRIINDRTSEFPDLKLLGRSSNHLKRINLYNCNLSGNKHLVLVKFMMQSLKELKCSNCSLTSADIVAFINYLKTANVVCENLTYWDLANNKIDDEGLMHLTEILPQLFPNIRGFWSLIEAQNTVDVFGNPVSNEFMLLCNRHMKAIEESLESAVLSDWRRTCLYPQNRKKARVFCKLWGRLISEMIKMAKQNKVSSLSVNDDSDPTVNEFDFPQLSITDKLQTVTPAEESHNIEETTAYYTQKINQKTTGRPQKANSVSSDMDQEENAQSIISSTSPRKMSTSHTAAEVDNRETASVIPSSSSSMPVSASSDTDQEEIVSPVITSTPPPLTTSTPAPCIELTLIALHKELKTLTKPISFGVSLGIPQEQLEIIQQDNRFDTEGQKIALFQYISKNYKTLGITWSSVAEALSLIEYRDLAAAIREKFTG